MIEKRWEKSTTMETIDDFNSFTIKQFTPGKDKFYINDRPTLYHYTSADSFYKIFKNSNAGCFIRFTDVRFLNDKTETQIVVERLREFINDREMKYRYCKEVVNNFLLRKCSAEEHETLSMNSLNISNHTDLKFVEKRSFVFCMSENGDSLHMWNYYIHNNDYQGYNIGFDLMKFIKAYDKTKESNIYDPIMFFWGPVLYEKESQFKELEKLCDKIEATKKDGMIFSLSQLYRYIRSYGMFFKDESFSDEKEYRILISLSEHLTNRDRSNYTNQFNQKIKLDFYERRGTIVPCLMVPIDISAIQRVTIAPTMEKELVLLGVKEYLEVNGIDVPNIMSSKIPIRY